MLIVLGSVLLLASSAVGAWFGMGLLFPRPQPQTAQVTPEPEEKVVTKSEEKPVCGTQESIKICIQLAKLSYQPTDEIIINASYTNTGTNSYRMTFPSACSIPEIYSGDKLFGDECVGAATETDETIDAGKTRDFHLPVDNYYLKQGVNKLSLQWKTLISQELSLTVNAPNKQDEVEYAKCATSNEKLRQCSEIVVYFDEKTKPNCAAFDAVIKSLNYPARKDSCVVNDNTLALSTGTVGKVTVYAPNSSYPTLIEEYKKLPGVFSTASFRK